MPLRGMSRVVSRCLSLSLVVSWLRLSLRVRAPAQEEGSSGMHTYHYKVVDSADAMKKDDWHRVVAVALPSAPLTPEPTLLLAPSRRPPSLSPAHTPAFFLPSIHSLPTSLSLPDSHQSIFLLFLVFAHACAFSASHSLLSPPSAALSPVRQGKPTTALWFYTEERSTSVAGEEPATPPPLSSASASSSASSPHQPQPRGKTTQIAQWVIGPADRCVGFRFRV